MFATSVFIVYSTAFLPEITVSIQNKTISIYIFSSYATYHCHLESSAWTNRWRKKGIYYLTNTAYFSLFCAWSCIQILWILNLLLRINKFPSTLGRCFYSLHTGIWGRWLVQTFLRLHSRVLAEQQPRQMAALQLSERIMTMQILSCILILCYIFRHLFM